MNLFEYGKQHYKLVSVPATNHVVFSDQKKLGDHDEYETQLGGVFYEIDVLNAEEYAFTGTIIDYVQSKFYIGTGDLIDTGEIVLGINLDKRNLDTDVMNQLNSWLYGDADYQIYRYLNKLYVNTAMMMVSIDVDPSQYDPTEEPLPYAIPNMIEAFASFGDNSFTYYFFISSDGFKVENTYLNTTISKPTDIVFYMETSGGSNAFGSVMRVKSGSEVTQKNHFAKAAVKNVLKYHNVDTAGKVDKIIRHHLEYKKEKSSKKEGSFTIVLKGVEYVINTVAEVKNFPLWGLEKVFSYISNDLLLEYAMAGENRWRYYNIDDSLNQEYSGMIPKDFIEAAGKLTESAFNVPKVFLEEGVALAFKKAKDELNALRKFAGLREIIDFIKKALRSIEKIFELVANGLGEIFEMIADFGKEILVFANAIYVGLWNSIVEILRGVFDLLALAFKLAQTPQDVRFSDLGVLGAQIQLVVETLENALDWFNNLITLANLGRIVAFFFKAYNNIITAITKVNPDRMGYILGFVVGLIVEELLDAFLTGGIKNVADIARYLKKSVDGALETIQNMGDAAVDVVKKGKRKLDDTAAGFINFMETINNLLRTTMDPDGFSKFLNDIAEKFEEFILGVKIDLIMAGQQRLDISLGVFANFKDLDVVLGKLINVATRKKISRLGIKILQDTENKAKFLVRSDAFNEVDGLLMNTRELNNFIEGLSDIADKDLPEFYEKYRKLERAKPRYFKNYKFMDLLNGKKPCFLAGTPVHTINGLKPIEEIEKGDMVLCYDTEKQQLDQKTVSDVFNNHTLKYRVITTENGDVIKATGQHLFYLKSSNTWIKCYQLKIGMSLYDAQRDGLVKITALETIEEKVPTYNLEVETHHNYLVGETGFVAHNGVKRPSYKTTSKRGYSFYELAFGRGTTEYVGKTTRDELTLRLYEHNLEGKRALKGKKPYYSWKARNISIFNLNEEANCLCPDDRV